jgi:hypothetical protein
MSIAVSAIVSPSRALRALLAAYGLANLAAAFAVGFGMPQRFAAPHVGALMLGLSGLVLLHSASARIKTRRIDISGVGQLRLTVQQDIQTRSADRPESAGVPVRLAAGSTVWPALMLLRLRSENGALAVLPVLPDSVAPGVFRALAVALRALGDRNKPLQGQHKIL